MSRLEQEAEWVIKLMGKADYYNTQAATIISKLVSENKHLSRMLTETSKQVWDGRKEIERLQAAAEESMKDKPILYVPKETYRTLAEGRMETIGRIALTPWDDGTHWMPFTPLESTKET